MVLIPRECQLENPSSPKRAEQTFSEPKNGVCPSLSWLMTASANDLKLVLEKSHVGIKDQVNAAMNGRSRSAAQYVPLLSKTKQ